MTINQKIKNDLDKIKGGYGRVSDILGYGRSASTNKFADDAPMIDSIKWVIAVSIVTGKPFEYYIEDNPDILLTIS